MDKDELLMFCKYYKGELESPYECGSDEDVFWYIEQIYVDNAIHFDDFRQMWIQEAENYIMNHPNENNILTDSSVNIEIKAIIIYIELMLTKWMPYKVDMIFKY